MVAVAERYMLVADSPGMWRQRLGMLRIGDGIDRPENLVDALHRCQTFLNRVGSLAQVFGRIDDAVKYHHVIYKLRGINAGAAAQNERTAKPQHYRDGRRTQKLAHRMSQRLATRYTIGQTIELLILAMETCTHLIFGVESLDDAQSAKGLLDIGHQYTPLVLPLKRLTLKAFAYTTHNHSGQRQQHKHKHSQLPRHGHHHSQAHDNHHRIFEHHIQRCHHRILDFGHIAAHTRHHIALALARKEPYG